ncbi:fluoride efflux transporter FluC [Loigolactobacillus backii]|uniref:fluoride efflux transporter FluC n=1 Tax=Loigolactobacillus backii TaxID=375175 RepID=UPI0007F11E00|nr:CrcB family protein [Loigolactobacillus backii]ANK60397.1 hypothetical protein AYR52_09125 [Loigolactobacillus backii]ANK65276.1 hypothetical protein AYR54_08530 [Loigolactobacillus backii]MDA5387356.1 CrcB family protein [Loigolactobacillus backii]MDA5389895.1 CrcB family protein [Loigolactobacillus backii]
MAFMLVGLGAAIGAVIRFTISNWVKRVANIRFPIATFGINLVGSFLIGLLSFNPATSINHLLFSTGVLGGLTTFSTLMNELVIFQRRGQWYSLLQYLILSTVLGVGLAYLGVWVAGWL